MLEMFTDNDPMRLADYCLPADGQLKPGHGGGGSAFETAVTCEATDYPSNKDQKKPEKTI